jgi:hypothetical protein
MAKSDFLKSVLDGSYKKRFYELVGIKPKPYPVPEEDSFIPPQDDSAEVKYTTKKNKHKP